MMRASNSRSGSGSGSSKPANISSATFYLGIRSVHDLQVQGCKNTPPPSSVWGVLVVQ